MTRQGLGVDDVLDERPGRVSGLAVASLVFSLVCCIPGTGVVGAILGGAAVIRIGGSEGRLTGRALAFVGLALGLLTTILWLAIGVGARQAISAYETRAGRPVSDAIAAMEKGDWSSARKVLDPAASGKVSDADLQAFAAAVKDKFGTLVVPSKGVDVVQLLFSSQPGITLPPGSNSMPWPLEFDRGTVWVIIVPDSPALAGEILMSGSSVEGKVTNLGVVSGAGQVWLVDPARKAKGGAGGPTGATGGTGTTGGAGGTGGTGGG